MENIRGSNEMEKERVMIAGIGGASLGTEIAKSLHLCYRYDLFGCDISKTAFGLYSTDFVKTFVIDRSNYIDNVIEVCHYSHCRWLIPGGEQPLKLLSIEIERLEESGIHLVANDINIIRKFSDKLETFSRLSELGIMIPKTRIAESDESVVAIGFPCIIKPSTDSGGSVFVFLAMNLDEAMVYIHFIRKNGYIPLVQEYIDDEEGEFTVGVLSLPDASVVGSIALRRCLHAKLSVAYRGQCGVVSSGNSQGYIGEYSQIQKTAETIAQKIQSRGPLNVQGRIRKGEFIPFEINPRFSASTYLRAMAGFNEVDMFLEYLMYNIVPKKPLIKPGWYLRSFTEVFVPEGNIK